MSKARNYLGASLAASIEDATQLKEAIRAGDSVSQLELQLLLHLSLRLRMYFEFIALDV